KKYFTESFRELCVRAPRASGELFPVPRWRKAAPRREAPKFLVFCVCAHCPALAASHADADGRYLTAQRLCSTITSTSHYILRRGFHAGRGLSVIRSASHIRSQHWQMGIVISCNCLCC